MAAEGKSVHTKTNCLLNKYDWWVNSVWLHIVDSVFFCMWETHFIDLVIDTIIN